MFPFGGKDGGELDAFSVERCPGCGAEEKRPFRAGDVLFAGGAECGCGRRMAIDRIFGEPAGGGGGGNRRAKPAGASYSSSSDR